jgi:SM-20-related protein
MHCLSENELDEIADALVETGYLVVDDLLPAELIRQLLTQFNSLDATSFSVAGTGRSADFGIHHTIRSDQIFWLEPQLSNTASAEFLHYMESLRVGINRRLFLGLFDYESHFAHYPIGAFYKKHLDSFRGTEEQGKQHKKNRVLSTVLYLNEHWQPNAGGELVIYAQENNETRTKVIPSIGRFVIFLSEKFPHEVLPATQARNSIAGWFRVNEGDIL